MSDITLSRGVRSNLLNLQRTADSIANTQMKLATGKRVNSALDNPTNFFTSSTLNSRASDLGNLMDSMANGIKTLEAADNGLKAITRTVESMQSTLRQARQDKSFKSQSFTLSPTANGNISFSGGAVGTTAVSVSVGGTPTATTAAGSQAVSTAAFVGGNVTVNGTNVAIRGDQAAVSTTLTGRSGNFTGAIAGGTFTIGDGTTTSTVTVRGDAAAVATTLNGAGGTFGTYTGGVIAIDGNNITIANNSDAATVQTAIDGILGAGYTVGNNGSGQLTLSKADGTDINITGDSTLLTTIGFASGNRTSTNGTEAFNATLSTVLTDIGNGSPTFGATLSAVDDGTGQIRLSLSSGRDVQLGGTDSVLNQLGFDSANRLSTNGSEAFNATDETVEADFDNAGITGLTASRSGGIITLNLASGADINLGGNATLLSAIGYATTGSRTSTNGVEANTTVESLVNSINSNTNLTNRVRASNDGGRLRIENLSTESLSVTGANSDNEINGSTGASNTQSVGGNEVRKNLIGQFNELRTQLDKLADDASFNGINLLRGDKLSLTFNETGTSSLDIQAKNSGGVVRGISTAESSLDIESVNAEVMQSDANIDSRLAGLGEALTTLRTQSSAFGSNLSVVQNRQDFTKSMMNTLRTGADNLTLADMNEEAANLLSLQTRQQLSSTALSLANQADQGVLRLF